ncbi:response regulator [Pseudoduganella violacea]|uniref:histidine kinase n=1 Tax=Pseudoduganella violacea TaxID=1715466 RepID=A0A7W5BBI5_9BURK|nr:response regulator [Pseudoduganella violacea]MBB3119943.1 signal transduction histidine kinase [Pseudoduganella violacea]
MIQPGLRPRILIVDDQTAHMGALCDILREHGYDTTGFASGEAALTRLRRESFDLLLSDLMMPGIDGIALVEAARQLDPELACVIMTGEGSIASAVKAMKVGALDYIIKPFKASALLPVLARALETRDLRLANAHLEHQLRQHAEELAAANRHLDLARREAERANLEKSVFLSNMSHELRTPLNGILGFAQILASDALPATPQEKQKFAGHIVQSGRHLLTLINEILDLAKIESGTLSMALEAVPLDQVFLECHTMVAPLAQQRGVQLNFPAPAGLQLQADRTRVKQVLLNLLSNAIKYNREHGSVFVECTPRAKDRLRIAVSDTGPGLSEEQLGAIFQPFNRLGRADNSEEGTGLGLALSKRVVEAMQAQMGVDSTVGVGSTFWIEVALQGGEADVGAAPPPSAASVPATAPPAAPAPTLRTVLYVEDNTTNLKLVTELIRIRGDLELLFATDGQRGLELARHHRPAVILMDLHLPGMDGYEALARLRADPQTAGIRVIAVTANAMSTDIARSEASDFFRYLTKPLDIDLFNRALDDALAPSALRRQTEALGQPH